MVWNVGANELIEDIFHAHIVFVDLEKAAGENRLLSAPWPFAVTKLPQKGS